MKHLLWLVLMLAPALAGASTFKCVDSDGSVTYSATPCGNNAKEMTFHDSGGYGDSEMEVRMDSSHSFRTQGTLNGAPVTFIIDTGASRTSISVAAAKRAGLKGCRGRGLALTAGGVTASCTAFIREITLGPLHFNNLEVMVMPNMPVEALFGMDLLKRLKVQQENGVMHLSTKK